MNEIFGYCGWDFGGARNNKFQGVSTYASDATSIEWPSALALGIC